MHIADFDLIVKGDANASKTVLCLHGYGADANDLAPLADVFAQVGPARWLFPNAPLEVPIGPHMMGRAWFPIDTAALERAMMSGAHRDFSTLHPEGFDQAVDRVMQLVQALGVLPQDLILGGFSQGGMVSAEVALRIGMPLSGLFLWSMNPVQSGQWHERLPALAGSEIFQSHGRQDPLLGFAAAEAGFAKIKEHHPNAEFVGFDGGHEIPQIVLRGSANFLARALGA